MKIKTINLFLIILIIAFLIAIYFSFNKYNFDYTSIKLFEWISSLSSFGTLVVAYLAFKKAPEWINRKMHDDAFVIAKKLMLYDYAALKQKIDDAGSIVDYQIVQYELVSDDFSQFISIRECSEAISIIHELNRALMKIRSSLESLSMLGWDVKDDISELNYILEKHCAMMSKNYISAFALIKRILIDKNTKIKDEYIRRSIINFRKFQENEKEFDVLYNVLRKKYKRIPHYFNIDNI